MEKKQFKRNIFLINPDFQLRISSYFVVLSVVNIGVFYLSIKYFFDIFTKVGKEIGLPENHVYFVFVKDQIFAMNMVFLVTSILTIILLLFAGVLISHKVAGPMYRLNNHLNDIADGKKELSEIKFREGDFFPEIADSFNRAIKKN